LICILPFLGDSTLVDCGYAAVVLKKPLDYYGVKGGAAYFMTHMLTALQHRGQQSAGLASWFPDRRNRLKVQKGVGLVESVFELRDSESFNSLMQRYEGTRAIGHVRWETSGAGKSLEDKIDEAQPFHRRHGRGWKRFAFAFNGTMANGDELTEFLTGDMDYTLDTEVDTELIMHALALGLSEEGQINKHQKPTMINVFGRVTGKLDGGYSLAYINGDGDIAVIRDPYGFMPSCYAETDDIFAAASESVALTKLGIPISDIQRHVPGTLLTYEDDFEQHTFGEVQYERPCFFQYNYLAHRDSLLDGTYVQEYRLELGRELARVIREQGIDTKDFVVSPVPETSEPIAEELARSLGLQHVHLLRKNSPGIRIYINDDGSRERLMGLKYNTLPVDIERKDLLLVDDSIVRGETSTALVKLVRDRYQPRSVHLVSATPPLVNTCHYGADIGVFGTHTVLVANRYPENLEQQLASHIGADSVIFMTQEGVRNVLSSFGISSSCMACVDGDYPTKAGQRLHAERVSSG
jgi:amidophosphoribosyltransferase